jgi:hypothetical protein
MLGARGGQSPRMCGGGSHGDAAAAAHGCTTVVAQAHPRWISECSPRGPWEKLLEKENIRLGKKDVCGFTHMLLSSPEVEKGHVVYGRGGGPKQAIPRGINNKKILR